jgi:hypothetical protein
VAHAAMDATRVEVARRSRRVKATAWTSPSARIVSR